MQASLMAECNSNENLHLLDGAIIEHISENNNSDASVTLHIVDNEHTQQQIHSKILIAADGTKSQVRQQFKFPTEYKDYHQIATLTKVTHQNHHLNMAHERFLKDGILALLPTPLKANQPKHLKNTTTTMQNGFVSSVVWLQNKQTAIDTKSLTQEQMLNELQQRFGQQYGDFLHATPCTTYHMQETIATATHKNNVILIGNAAHSLHPVAGQGLNLGLQDANKLAQQISLTGCNADSLRAFATVQKETIADIRRFVNDLLERFASPHPLSALSRTMLMIAFEKCTAVRHPFLHHLSGVQSSPPWFWKTTEQLNTLRQKISL